MKLDFNFDSTEFSKLTDDSGKSSKATMELSHAMSMVQAPAEFKIPASVKKVRVKGETAMMFASHSRLDGTLIVDSARLGVGRIGGSVRR